MRYESALRACLILLVICSVPTAAQTSTADLAGTVTDDSGNPLPGATVSAINSETGFSRSDTTDDRGAYRIPALPFGTYDATACVQGFGAQVQKGIRLDVGRTAQVGFVLRLSSPGETLEVAGPITLMERTDSQIATVVTPEQVAHLPLNERQFANLAVLAPGTSLVDNPDPTRLTNLAVSSAGGLGRNLNITIDGGDNTDDTIGGINEFYPLESIAEFNFLTSSYKAEYGRASGGVLNVVTKAGSNDYHGSFFSFFRDDALNALSRPEKDAGLTDPPPYSREQLGGSFGGPIAKNRAQFFMALEREQLDIPVVVDTFGLEPESDGPQNVPTRQNLYTAKVAVTLDPRQFLTVRYGQQKITTMVGAAPDRARSSWSSFTNTFHSILAAHNYLVSEDRLNELVIQYADFYNRIDPASEDPTEIFYDAASGTYVTVGQYEPFQQNQQKKFQMKDDFSWSASTGMGIHHFKAGVQWIHEPTVGGAVFNDRTPAAYWYAGSSREVPIVYIERWGGVLQWNVPNNQYGAYFQDDWSLNRRLTLNLGVRYDYVTGFDLDQSHNPLYAALVDLPYDFSWLDSVRNNPGGKLSNDANNIAPRLGFTFDWNGDGRLVLHGAFGIFYDFPFTNGNILFSQTSGLSGIFYQHGDFDSPILNPDGSYLQVGAPLPPNELPGPVLVEDAASPDFTVPYTRQISFGFSKLIGGSSALDVNYVNAAGRDRYVRFRINGIINGERLLPGFSPAARFWYNGAFSDYHALNITFRHQLGKRHLLHAAYTLSRTTGNTLFGSDEFRLGGSGGFWPYGCANDCSLDLTIGPRDDPRMRGPLFTDARHRLVIGVVADLPFHFSFSGLFRFNSARPYNAFLPVDTGGGFRYSITDPHVNSRKGAIFSQLDIRIGKSFEVSNVNMEAIVDVYNLFNSDNPLRFIGNLKNPGFGEPLVFGDPRQIQLGFRIGF